MPARAAPSGRCTVRAHFLCLDSINTTSGDRGDNPQGQGSITISAPPLLPRSQQKAPPEIGKNRQNGAADDGDDNNKNGLGVLPLVSIRSSCDTIVRYTPRRRSPADASCYRTERPERPMQRSAPVARRNVSSPLCKSRLPPRVAGSASERGVAVGSC
jgi:hypothetical protein